MGKKRRARETAERNLGGSGMSMIDSVVSGAQTPISKRPLELGLEQNSNVMDDVEKSEREDEQSVKKMMEDTLGRIMMKLSRMEEENERRFADLETRLGSAGKKLEKSYDEDEEGEEEEKSSGEGSKEEKEVSKLSLGHLKSRIMCGDENPIVQSQSGDSEVLTQLLPVESPPVLELFERTEYLLFIRKFREYKRRGGRLGLSACISEN
ncbi:hypothetical protein ADUPG1_008259, partial [Aduncisulcus paluster]